MKMPKLKSLQFKILLPAILTTVILLLGLGVFMGLRARATMSAVLTANAESTAAFLEEVGIPYILNYDFPALDRIVSQVVKDPEVEFVVYYDAKGKVLTQNSKEKPTAGDTLLLERELKDPDSKNLVGRMKFAFSLGGVARQFHQDVIAIAAAIGGGGFLVLISLLYAVRRSTKPLDAAIDAIAESSNRVAAASVQVSSASQQLADGNSEQAASIEETSSSLEEMASITKSNAENTERVVALIQEASRVAGQANTTMVKLTRSMEEISTASQETSKIIKTIDEIAFQTNLLALNAAVEAARAGEAGAGFAVVADEVRNLAMRAAEAARNTAGLIEGTVSKVKDGSTIVANTNSAFLQVADSVQQATTVIDEIAAASRQQAQGIEQISTAVGTMDQMVQQAAANAEESASLSVEMSTQADALRSVVEQLAAVVGGNREKSTESSTSAEEPRAPVRTASTRTPVPVRAMAKQGNGVSLLHSARFDQEPRQGQGDFKEF